MTSAYRPGDDVCGCVVVHDQPRRGGVRLRCPCGCVFLVTTARVRKNVRHGYRLRCPGCWRQGRHPRPESEIARRAVELLDHDGENRNEVARRLGVTPQTVEKWWLRWVVLPERDRLRERVRELEGSA